MAKAIVPLPIAMPPCVWRPAMPTLCPFEPGHTRRWEPWSGRSPTSPRLCIFGRAMPARVYERGLLYEAERRYAQALADFRRSCPAQPLSLARLTASGPCPARHRRLCGGHPRLHRGIEPSARSCACLHRACLGVPTPARPRPRPRGLHRCPAVGSCKWSCLHAATASCTARPATGTALGRLR